MKNEQDNSTTLLTGKSIVSEFAKGMQQYYRMVNNPTISAIQSMQVKSFYEKYAIPKTTLDAIISVSRQHEQLFGSLRSITELINKNQVVFNQINSWQFAISDISGQLAVIAASQRRWDLIDEFEEITEEVVSLNERIFDDNGVTRERLDELKEFFQRIESKIDKIDTDANSLFWKLLTILGFILAVVSEIRNWLPQPEYATKQEVEAIIKEQFSIYGKKLKEEKEFRITNRICKVMSKPQMKSLVIAKLSVDFEVVVLNVNHEWVYVQFFNYKDGLPQTGWIMKKYLDKPE
jgi:hypothetical protein